MKLKQSYYEQGEKSAKILATTNRKVYSLYRSSKWENCCEPFFERLYSSECSPSLTTFLNALNIPKLSEEKSKTLDEEITQEEKADATDSMQAGKAAGLDGIPVHLYKHFSQNYCHPYWSCFRNPSGMVSFLHP